MADRARIPPGCTVLRLEEFDDGQVGRWLDAWNRTNSHQFRSGVHRRLTLESAMACRPLSSQPLLLMMIALYAANPALPEPGGDDVTLGALYNALVDEFIVRELRKGGIPCRVGSEIVQDTRFSLGLAAFAMFNRGKQYVDEKALERDFEHFYGADVEPAATSFQESLSRPQRIIGAFFFVHKSEAGRDGDYSKRRSYEFLHATVGEFLVAKIICEVMLLAAAGQRGRRDLAGVRLPRDVPGGSQASLLTVLLSSQVLAKRRTINGFLADLGGLQEAGQRQGILELATQLIDYVFEYGVPRGYAFASVSQVSRMATLVANLISIKVALNGPTAVADISTARSIERWRSAIRLLRCGLDADSWLAFSESYVVTQAGPDLVVMDGQDSIVNDFIHRPSATEVADLAEKLLLGYTQAEMRLATSGLHQLIDISPDLTYMASYFDGIASLMVFQHARTDPMIYRRLASMVLSFPGAANPHLLSTIPMVLKVVARDDFDGDEAVQDNIARLLTALRQRISNFEHTEGEWNEPAAEWLRKEYERRLS